MTRLALSGIADSTVGDFSKRGISGGEKKRLSVACELLGNAILMLNASTIALLCPLYHSQICLVILLHTLTCGHISSLVWRVKRRSPRPCHIVLLSPGNPRLLIADEPTSGLDAYQAFMVVQLMQRLARDEGLAVVLSIHQPRSSIWASFDDILLMAPGGRAAYFGPREDMISYFASLKGITTGPAAPSTDAAASGGGVGVASSGGPFVCPPQTNPAEYFIDLVSLDFSSPQSLASSKERVDFIVEAFAKRQSQSQPQSSDPSKGKSARDEGSHPYSNSDSNATTGSLEKPLPVMKQAARSVRELVALPGRAAGALGRSARRLLLLLQRSQRQAWRDLPTLITRLLVSGVLAATVGSMHGQRRGAGAEGGGFTSDSVASRINLLSQAASEYVYVCV